MSQVRVGSAKLVEGSRPRSCVRHGNAVADGSDVDLQSRPQHDMSPTFGGVFSILVRTADHLQDIERVPVQGWPFCELCVRRRRRLRRAAQALFFGGVVLVVAAVVVALQRGQEPLLMIPMLVGVAAALGSGFVFGQSSWSHIASARVSDDGRWVTFADAHPAFLAEMRSASED